MGGRARLGALPTADKVDKSASATTTKDRLSTMSLARTRVIQGFSPPFFIKYQASHRWFGSFFLCLARASDNVDIAAVPLLNLEIESTQ